jgi:hypothetical protein
MRTRVCTLLLSLLVLTISTAAQDHKRAMGVWVLNTQRSTFSPGPLPQRQTSTWTRMPDGSVKIENDSVDPAGKTSHREMVSRFDGKQEMRSGPGQPPSRAYRWISDLDFEFDEMIDDKPSVTGRSSTSKDGNVRTLTVNGTRNGQPVHNIEVYERGTAASSPTAGRTR